MGRQSAPAIRRAGGIGSARYGAGLGATIGHVRLRSWSIPFRVGDPCPQRRDGDACRVGRRARAAAPGDDTAPDPDTPPGVRHCIRGRRAGRRPGIWSSRDQRTAGDQRASGGQQASGEQQASGGQRPTRGQRASGDQRSGPHAVEAGGHDRPGTCHGRGRHRAGRGDHRPGPRAALGRCRRGLRVRRAAGRPAPPPWVTFVAVFATLVFCGRRGSLENNLASVISCVIMMATVAMLVPISAVARRLAAAIGALFRPPMESAVCCGSCSSPTASWAAGRLIRQRRVLIDELRATSDELAAPGSATRSWQSRPSALGSRASCTTSWPTRSA